MPKIEHENFWIDFDDDILSVGIVGAWNLDTVKTFQAHLIEKLSSRAGQPYAVIVNSHNARGLSEDASDANDAALNFYSQSGVSLFIRIDDAESDMFIKYVKHWDERLAKKIPYVIFNSAEEGLKLAHEKGFKGFVNGLS